jgi:hypothetical protein
MTEHDLSDTEEQKPLLVGETQPDVHYSQEQARRIVHRRLAQVPGGALLTDKGIARLAQRLTSRQYAAGETIVHKGVPAGFMGVVTKGRLAVYSPPEPDSLPARDRDSPTVLLLPGSTFGEAMLIDGRPSGSTLRAITDVEIYSLRRGDLLAVASRRSARVARRFDTWWGLAVAGLALLAMVVIAGAYFGAEVLGLIPIGGRVPPPPASPEVSDTIQIVDPQDQQVLQRTVPLPVQAVLTEPGFSHAELLVGGRGQGAQVNPKPKDVPWIADWDWQEVSYGSQVLSVQALGTKGRWRVSSPVTVTVVPTGTLAFASNRDGMRAVYIMRTDGRDVQRLLTGPGEARQPAWGEQSSLAFVAEVEPGKPVIRWMDSSAGEPVELLAGRDPAWAPGSTRLAYAASIDNISQIFTVAMPAGVPYQVTEQESFAGQPTWSPDGNQLAYVVQQEGNWDIWVQALDGSEPQRLTEDPAMDWAPVWSPDGSRLAFVSNREGNHQIFVMRPDGTGLQRLTDLPQGAESPAWAPDGYWLAFVAYSGSGEGVNAREIHLMRADGQDQVRLTYNDADDTQPAWSLAR